ETAASIIYSVLGGGPGSDWETIGAYYANPQAYLNQLSSLSDFVARNPDRNGPRFLLAYHLLVVGRPDAAYAQLAEILQRNPQDQVTASLMQALSQPSAPEMAYAP
ncbi:MAG: hypothetical protein JNG89_09115, partial [Planctomycetaceae bacterium]|nr:hypothetical protein [Planctomycetaceae bacterium]